MVKVKVWRDENKKVTAFRCEGHAGYISENDEFDMVCAAVSGIVYSALGYMEEYYGIDDFNENDGFIEWKRQNKIKESIVSNISPVLDAMVVGLKQIELQYGKNIKVVD